MAVLHENAMPSWALVFDAMDAAPSLPDGVHGLGLDTVPDADPALMVLAHQGILDLILALNSLLPQVADRAASTADRAVAATCTALCRRTGRLLHRQAEDVPEPGRPATGATLSRHPHAKPACRACACQPRRSRRS